MERDLAATIEARGVGLTFETGLEALQEIDLSIAVKICDDKSGSEVILGSNATYEDIALQANVEHQWFSFLRVDLTFDGFVPIDEAECQGRNNPDTQ